MSTVTCSAETCYATICLDDGLEQRLRATHETFYCPAGHPNYYPKRKPKPDERIVTLERANANLRDLLSTAADRVSDWRWYARQCPFDCGYHVTRKSKPESIRMALAFHLIEEHGAHFPEPADREKATTT